LAIHLQVSTRFAQFEAQGYTDLARCEYMPDRLIPPVPPPTMNSIKFTWSEAKRKRNLSDHGLDFADVERVFAGSTFTFRDDRFPYAEQRFITLGFLAGIVVSIAHTETEDEIHPISFRKATRREADILVKYIQN
jgi:uncharacterized DUF497 family protein